MQAWEYYYTTFQERAARVPADAFGRNELLYEVAHDAYQATADRMTADGSGEGEVLTVTRMFGQVVKDWLARDGQDLPTLRENLRRQYQDWVSPPDPS